MQRIYLFFRSHQLIFLLLIYFIFRLPFLTLLPIFIDESTYLDWGWRTIHISGRFFYPLLFAKMPLIMWFFGIFQTFIPDPLLAGRLVSVLLGTLSLTGLYRISNHLFSSRVGFITGILYISTPVFAFYDRQALMENSVSATGIWTCYFLLRLIAHPHIKWSILTSAVLSFGFLAKSNSLIFFPPLFLLIFYSAVSNPQKRIVLFQQLIFIPLFFLVFSSLILFQPAYWSKAGDIFFFSLTPSEITGTPILFWINNLYSHLEISFWHLTPTLMLAVILGFRKIPILSGWTLTTLLITTLLVRNSTTRYLTPYLPPLLIFAANWLSKKSHLIPLFILPGILISGLLIFSPPSYFRILSSVTRYSQIADYLTGRDTGYQALATVSYLKKQLPPGPVFLGVAANAGNPEQAVFTYLRRRSNTVVGYLDDHTLTNFESIDCLTASIPVYFIARHDQQGGLEKFYQKQATVTNPYNQDFNSVYTLNPKCQGKSFNIDVLIDYYRSQI